MNYRIVFAHGPYSKREDPCPITVRAPSRRDAVDRALAAFNYVAKVPATPDDIREVTSA